MKCRMKFWVGKTLAIDRTWDLNKSLMDEITDDTESLIEEAIETNDPGVHQREEEGIEQ